MCEEAVRRVSIAKGSRCSYGQAVSLKGTAQRRQAATAHGGQATEGRLLE